MDAISSVMIYGKVVFDSPLTRVWKWGKAVVVAMKFHSPAQVKLYIIGRKGFLKDL